jgi:hypothetical protein
MKQFLLTVLLAGFAFSGYSQLTPLTDVIKASETSSNDSIPYIVAGKSGKILTAWKNSNKIYGQLFDRSGEKEGGNIEMGSPGKVLFFKLFADTSGRFLLVWADAVKDVYGQYLNEAGEKSDAVFKIASAEASWKDVDFTVNSKGEAALVYRIYNGYEDERIYIRVFNLFLKTNPVERLAVLEQLYAVGTSEPKVYIDESGNFLVNWKRSFFGTPAGSSASYSSVIISSDLKVGEEGQGYFNVEGMDSGFAGSIIISESRDSYFGPFHANLISVEGATVSLPVSHYFGLPYYIYDNQNPRMDMGSSGDFIITFSGVNTNHNGYHTIYATSVTNGISDTVEIAPRPGAFPVFNSVLTDDLYGVVFIADDNKASVRFYRFNSLVSGISENAERAKSRLIYPERFDNYLTVEENADVATFSICTINGTVVKESQTRNLSTEGVVPGFYIGMVKLRNGEIKTQKLVKE